MSGGICEIAKSAAAAQSDSTTRLILDHDPEEAENRLPLTVFLVFVDPRKSLLYLMMSYFIALFFLVNERTLVRICLFIFPHAFLRDMITKIFLEKFDHFKAI